MADGIKLANLLILRQKDDPGFLSELSVITGAFDVSVGS